MVDHQRLRQLCRLGRLLDEAVDIADQCGDTLIGAQIAEVLETLDARVRRLQPPPFARDRGHAGTPKDGRQG